MNEATICSKLVQEYKAQLIGCVTIKHADRATIGVPDLSLTWSKRTSWQEIKYLRRQDLKEFPLLKPSKVLGDSAQRLMMANLKITGLAWYLLYTHHHKVIYLDPQHAFYWARDEEEINVPYFQDIDFSLYDHPCFYTDDKPSTAAKIALHWHKGEL
jgi:hypothetical protein